MTQKAKDSLCSVAWCRREATLIVKGVPFCEAHNAERLEALEREAVAILKGTKA